jgi:hypothetical protein
VELPAAKQVVALGHDTPSSVPPFAPAGSGTAASDQLVPFHTCTRDSAGETPEERPTAKQAVVLGHDTRNRLFWSPLPPGLEAIDQLVPFHCCTKVAEGGKTVPDGIPYEPTAKHVVVVGHDTPLRPLPDAPAGLGLASIDHVVPFHSSTNVLGGAAAVNVPTAKHRVVVGHDTPARPLLVAPTGLGLATIDQVVPFHCSTKVFVAEPVVNVPTAMQLVGLGHATPPRELLIAPAGWAVVSIDQLVPFQCSTSSVVSGGYVDVVE